jgi:hypothetical protein
MDPLNDLRNSLTALDKESVDTKCPVAKLIDKIYESDRELGDITKRLIDGNSVSSNRLTQELRSAGYRIAKENVAYHRRGICRCALEGRPQ